MPNIPHHLRGALRRRSTYGFLAIALVIVVGLALASGGDDAEDPDSGLRNFERGPDIDM